MNILKRMAKLKAFMAESYELVKNLPEDRQKIVHTGMYYTATLDSKVRAWVKDGQKTFILSKELIEAFRHTDISFDMFPSDFQYPFNNFVIEGEAPFFETKTFSDQLTYDDHRWVDTILYVNVQTMLDSGSITMDLYGKIGEKPDWHHSLTALFPGTDGGLENIMTYMDKDKTIRDAIETRKVGNMMLPIENSDAKGMVNIFFNTILYINDPTRNREETEVTGSRKMKIDGKKAVRSNYIFLKPPKKYKSLYHGSGKTLDKRFIVRGHWRNQACGEGMKQHKRMWIFPYWKGPEMSEIVSKPYVISK